MTNMPATTARAGYSNAQQGTERVHTLMAFVIDRPGAVDRVVGVLRRKRARLQSFSLAPVEKSEIIRITAQVKDTEVLVDNLLEQIRKIVDVKQALNLTDQQTVVRELALIKVAIGSSGVTEMLEVGQQFGAMAVDVSSTAITFEASGNVERLEKLLQALQVYDIREVARSGCVAMTRVASDK